MSKFAIGQPVMVYTQLNMFSFGWRLAYYYDENTVLSKSNENNNWTQITKFKRIMSLVDFVNEFDKTPTSDFIKVLHKQQKFFETENNEIINEPFRLC